MSVLKYYDETTSTWIPVAKGEKGDTGATGATGPEGPQGIPGETPTLSSLGITATAAELNYTDGVTSSIQTQLNAKAPINSPTFTGTVTAPTFVGALSGNASTATLATSATTATGIQGSDTRYNNKAPSSYIGLGADMYLAPTYSRSEFKSISTMGLGSYLTGSYCYVMTHVPWSDISGGVPVQIAYGSGVPCYRLAVDNATWGAWTPINSGGTAATISGLTATAAELNVLDGITATVTELNYVDGVTSAIQTQLDAKAATASPTFTGTAKGDFVEGKQALGSINGGCSVVSSSGTVVTATITGATQFTLAANSTTDYCRVLTFILTNGGSATITWPSSVKWAGGTAPTLSASGVDILHFMTVDNGTTWYGCLGGKGFA